MAGRLWRAIAGEGGDASGAAGKAAAEAGAAAGAGAVERALLALRQEIFPAADGRAARAASGQADVAALRAELGDLLIRSGGPEPLSDGLLEAVDRVYEEEVPARGRPLPPEALDGLWLAAGGAGGCRLVVWRGDITRLAVDAVVNAANDQGLGCFQPSHRCIDNVLHRAAGPRLRESCRREMAGRRGRLLSAGTDPIFTVAHHLPCRHVVHTTGPQLAQGRPPSELQRRQLAHCYRSCLDRCRNEGLRSIAFCCISTGLFGYPSEEAAQVALREVRDWLSEAGNSELMDFVVFDVFTRHDQQAYERHAPSLFNPLSDKPAGGDGPMQAK